MTDTNNTDGAALLPVTRELFPCPTPWCARGQDPYIFQRGPAFGACCPSCNLATNYHDDEGAAVNEWNTRISHSLPATQEDAERGGVGDGDLRAHFTRMMEAAANYLEPTTYIARHPQHGLNGPCWFTTEFPMPDENHSDSAKADINRRRDQAFILDMIYMLDGPEQRAALSTPQEYAGEAVRELIRDLLPYAEAATASCASNDDYMILCDLIDKALAALAHPAQATPSAPEPVQKMHELPRSNFTPSAVSGDAGEGRFQKYLADETAARERLATFPDTVRQRLINWQEGQSEWFSDTLLEIVAEFIAFDDASRAGEAENKAGGLWYRRWHTAQTRLNELEQQAAAPTPSPCPGDGMREALQLARDRLADMLMGDDGQAWKEAEKALPIIDAALTPSALSGDAGEGALRAAIAKIAPITVHMGEEYAEVFFADGQSHSTQAMTMNPQDWLDIQAAYEASHQGAGE